MPLHKLFKCPISGFTVQGRFEVEPVIERPEEYREVDCPGCGLAHFVNATTGKVLGQK